MGMSSSAKHLLKTIFVGTTFGLFNATLFKIFYWDVRKAELKSYYDDLPRIEAENAKKINESIARFEAGLEQEKA